LAAAAAAAALVKVLKVVFALGLFSKWEEREAARKRRNIVSADRILNYLTLHLSLRLQIR
jgi:hypothetical protein